MWRTYWTVTRNFENVDDPKLKRQIVEKIQECPDNLNYFLFNYLGTENYKKALQVTKHTIYRNTVCRVVNKIGDILTAHRRRSWIGMPLYETRPRGLQIHATIKSYILYGRVIKGTLKCHTDNKEYRF